MHPFTVAVPGSHLPHGRVSRWRTGAYALNDTYVEAAARAGLFLTLLPAGAGADALDAFDGLLLLGGPDIDPGAFGERALPETYGVDADRDASEIDMVLSADRTGIPTLAICRGAQVVNVAFGGTLHQHLPAMEGLIPHGVPGGGEPAFHEVDVVPGSRLAACGNEKLLCASHHHQGIDRVGKGLAVVARSADGLVEAIERPSGWMVAVQWHPEDTTGEDPAQQALFDAFAREIEDRVTPRRRTRS